MGAKDGAIVSRVGIGVGLFEGDRDGFEVIPVGAELG